MNENEKTTEWFITILFMIILYLLNVYLKSYANNELRCLLSPNVFDIMSIDLLIVTE